MILKAERKKPSKYTSKRIKLILKGNEGGIKGEENINVIEINFHPTSERNELKILKESHARDGSE